MPTNEKKKGELDLWKEWKKTGQPKPLADLLKSMKPLMSSQIQKYSGAPIPRPILEAHANTLTIEAFKSFDPKKAGLNTHVVNHLRHLNRFVIENQNIARIPEHRALQIGNFHSAVENLSSQLGRIPNTHELADHLKISPKNVERLQRELRKDYYMNYDEDAAFFNSAFWQSDKKLDAVHYVYHDMDPINKSIMDHYFGMGGNNQKTVPVIARLLKMKEVDVKERLKSIATKVTDIIKFL